MGQLKGENVLDYNMVIFFFKNTCAYKEHLFFVCSRDKYNVSLTTKQPSIYFYHFIKS